MELIKKYYIIPSALNMLATPMFYTSGRQLESEFEKHNRYVERWRELCFRMRMADHRGRQSVRATIHGEAAQ